MALMKFLVITSLLSFIFLCNLFVVSVNNHYENPAPYFIDDAAINCGYHGNSTSLDGRHWVGDTGGTRSVISMFQPKGKSTSSTADHRSLAADPILYMAARISTTEFYYTFQVNPGKKFVRLHFYPSSYRGFESFQDFFTVKAGHFTLLKNFSASFAVDALGVKYLVKEFGLSVEENKYLNITFSPSLTTKNSRIYAFVNAIEIISMPTGLYYTPDGDSGARIVAQRSRFHYVDNTTALELVQRLNIGGSSISPGEDFALFRRWSEDDKYFLTSDLLPANHLVCGIKYIGIPVYTAPLKIYQTSWKVGNDKRRDREMHNFTWKIPVDVGFGYLVRLHFCDFELEAMGGGRREFNILINNQVAEDKADVIIWSDGFRVPTYRDYMVMVKGEKEAGKSDLLIALMSSDELVIGLVNGIEIFKLSNPDNKLASSNPLKQVSTSWSLNIKNILLAFGRKNVIVTSITVLLILLNLTVFHFRKNWEEFCPEEKDPRSALSASCRRFSLAEILSATQNFSDAFVIGKGGFGNVYKGFIHGSSKSIVVKRLKQDSKQGAREFWTEIEILSKIRHTHLVSLIGYCNDNQEMILVYEYMPRGTLAGNLYKIGRNGKVGTPLTWEQRLRICIGAARGLDYLHTGIEFGVIHRDVKDSNILLDENLVAKISDFGLSKLGKVRESQGSTSTKVKGTFGYLDPDYFITHKPTRKTDVYAFGVVMLVVLCGRPAIDARLLGERKSILSLFQECMTKGDIDEIIDPSLRGNFSLESLKEFIKSVENCVQPQPKRRPTMSQLVTILEYALELQQRTMSSKSEEAATSSQPSNGVNKVDEFSISPTYKELPNGQEIAVKKLARSSGQGVENYQFTCKLQHRNIVRLLGFCFEGEEKLLVHEFLPNKSLDNFLFDSTKKPMLDWSKRQKIIEGIARGLHYLHDDFQPRIIHCDLKASNILLDANMNPKISDFGFARIMGVDQSEGETTITRSAGIFGYMPPECALYGVYSVKSYVYSFGILVLEIICGKKCTVRFHQSDSTLEYLIGYVWRNWRDGTPLALVDPVAGDSYDRNEVIRCIHVALLCIQDVELRPTMASAVIMLDSNSSTLLDPQQPAELLLRTQHNETESITESGPL